jgi:hypothetical protein
MSKDFLNFTNPVEVSSDEDGVEVWDGHKKTVLNSDDWDIEVTVKAIKKVKPLPHGTLLKGRTTLIYLKSNDKWYFTNQNWVTKEWIESSESEATIRRISKPLVEGEWE